MEKELVELFESVRRAADAAETSPGDEDRCLDVLKQLKKFPVNYHLLVSTQVGKRLRQLTKHRSNKIKTLASDVVEIWKNIIVKETAKNKKNGSGDDVKSPKAGPASMETSKAKNINRTNSIKAEQDSVKKSKLETVNHSTASNSSRSMKSETEKSTLSPAGPPKLTSLVYCKDPLRDKVREILAESLSKVSTEVSDADDDLKDQVYHSDANRIAVLVETAMFDKWGKSNGAQKFKYRSIMFNIKDPNNPDFRRKVLVGDFSPSSIPDLTPEQMASDARQVQNEKLKQKALFNSERAAAPKASTNEFTCGRCKKKETTYYQMQTRSADEPMTTYVTCVNCGNNWKFC